MPTLFDPFRLRDVLLRNRVAVSPMCQYSCQDGLANDWHLVHLGSRATGGAGLVFAEATAVVPEGRISPQDLGLWSEAHAEPLARVAAFVRAQGAAAGIQLAHAGRKASTTRPWDGHAPIAPGALDPSGRAGWTPVGPSALAFDAGYTVPHALDEAGIARVIAAFADAARWAREAGFQVIELHAAHGYLLHEFLSPLSNRRDDRWGGSFDHRVRLVEESVAAVRREWPERLPLFLRISATDWVDGGWTVEDSVTLARRVHRLGVDLVDCSSGGNVPTARIPVGPGYQVPFAERVRREAALPTGAVGMITEPLEADAIVREGKADIIFLARALLRDPYWPLHAARQLGAAPPVPPQYQRAF